MNRHAINMFIVTAALFPLLIVSIGKERVFREFPHDYLLICALVFSAMPLRSLAERPFSREDSKLVNVIVLLYVTAFFNMGVAAVLLQSWWASRYRLEAQFLNEPQMSELATAPNQGLIVTVFLLGFVVLFAHDLSDQALLSAVAKTNLLFAGLANMVLIASPAVLITAGVYFFLGYPNQLATHATVFALCLALVVLVREGMQRHQARSQAKEKSRKP